MRFLAKFSKLKKSLNVKALSKNHVIITYWLEKRVRKLTFLKHSFFWKDIATVNLKKFSGNKIFRCYPYGKFYMVKINYFSGRPNKGKKRFETFLIDYWAGDIRNKNISGT